MLLFIFNRYWKTGFSTYNKRLSCICSALDTYFCCQRNIKCTVLECVGVCKPIYKILLSSYGGWSPKHTAALCSSVSTFNQLWPTNPKVFPPLSQLLTSGLDWSTTSPDHTGVCSGAVAMSSFGVPFFSFRRMLIGSEIPSENAWG